MKCLCFRTLEVYFKPSYFKYNLRAWDLSEFLSPVVLLEDAVPKRGGKLVAGKKLPKTKDNKSSKTTTKSKGDEKKTVKSEKKTKKEKEITTQFSDWPVNLKKTSFFYLSILWLQILVLMISF